MMIKKNEINWISKSEFAGEFSKIKNISSSFTAVVDLSNVIDDASFIEVVSKTMAAPVQHDIYKSNLTGFADYLTELPWFNKGQKYQSYWLFILDFNEMKVKDGESGWSGDERKQHYFEVFQDDLVKWWTEDIVKYGGINGAKHVRDFTVIFVD